MPGNTLVLTHTNHVQPKVAPNATLEDGDSAFDLFKKVIRPDRAHGVGAG
jgi:hypothetical protein